MARSSILTLLPLDHYAWLMNVPAAHFNNLDDGRTPSACRPFWQQAHHDEIALAISQAEEKLRRHLHYDIAPAWRSETLAFGDAEAAWYADWRTVPLVASCGHINEFGKRASELFAADVPVAYAGDYASLSVSVSGINDTSELHVYYRVLDGADEAGSEQWEIRPLRAIASGTTALLVGSKALFAKPAVREADYPAPYEDAASFVTHVDVYRVYTDPRTPVRLVWDAESGADPSGNTTQAAAARLLDPESGQFQVRPAEWNEGTKQHIEIEALRTDVPERVEVWYRAGYRLGPLDRIDAQLVEAVLRLANTLLPERGLPFCDPTTKMYMHDRELDQRTGLMFGELFAIRVADLRKRPNVVMWQAV